MPNNKVKIYSVSEITKRINSTLENSFPDIWIEGEVSNLSRPASGHIYFSLKDKTAQLKCVIFKNLTNGMKFELEDGLNVLCFGRIGVYQFQGQYQLYIEKVEPKGYGALQLAFEQLKERLKKEGLFQEEHKKPLPFLPKTIGIVTSGTGAAIRDILSGIDKRFPNVRIIINPVRVQGKEAPPEIARAIKEFNEYKDVDVLIIGRGGGSLEDLWAFNEEVVARAIFSSKIPIISAVGHEVDYTISDFVADGRAATPTKAAEMVIANKEELEEKLLNLKKRLGFYLKSYVENLKKHFINLAASRFFKEPDEIFIQKKQHMDELSLKLKKDFINYIRLKTETLRRCAENLFFRKPEIILKDSRRTITDMKQRLIKNILQSVNLKSRDFKNCVARLQALSPLAVLTRGYSITYHLPSKKALTKIKEIKVKDSVKTVLSDGEFISVVREVNEGETYGAKRS